MFSQTKCGSTGSHFLLNASTWFDDVKYTCIDRGIPRGHCGNACARTGAGVPGAPGTGAPPVTAAEGTGGGGVASFGPELKYFVTIDTAQ